MNFNSCQIKSLAVAVLALSGFSPALAEEANTNSAPKLGSQSQQAMPATPRSNYGDYRLVSSLHNLTIDQVKNIDQIFDEALAKTKTGMPISAARAWFFAEVKKGLKPEQVQELDKFRDPLAGNESNLTVQHDLPYISPSDPMRTGDLYLPKDSKGKTPAVLFIHGGGWVEGSKEQSTHTAIELAKHGFAVYNINYRLVGNGGEYPADIFDVKDAFAFLAQKASDWNIDPKRIAVMGGSAGAHLSMMLAYTGNDKFPAEHYPKSTAQPIAVVSWFGPVDLELSGQHPLVQHYLAKGGKDAGHDASPINYALSAKPTLFVHGTEDPLVSITNSERMQKALQEKSITSELVPIKGAKHGFKDQEWTEAISKTIDFLDKQFGKARASSGSL